MAEEGNIHPSESSGSSQTSEPHWSTGVNTIRNAQKAMAAEAFLNVSETADRFRSEVHLWNEMLSKMAAAQSIRDLAVAWQECSRHQIDFARRETDRMLDHGVHAIDLVAGLLKSGKRQDAS